MKYTSKMKSLQYEGFIKALKAQPIKFLVGESKEEVFLHPALVASNSEALGQMINDASVGGKQGSVVLEDDDVSTITAFAEFIYTGNYHISSDMPTRTTSPPGTSSTVSRHQDNCDDDEEPWKRPQNNYWNKFVQSKEYGFQAPSRASLNPRVYRRTSVHEGTTAAAPNFSSESFEMDYFVDFMSLVDDIDEYYDGARWTEVTPTPGPGPGPEPRRQQCTCKAFGYEDNSAAASVLNPGSMDTDYSQFFIAHAKVFIFADRYGVTGLLDLSMPKLHEALCGFRLSKARVGDILALVRFCYQVPCPGKLRRLVASYSAAIMDIQVSRDVAKSFQELLKEREDFGADVAWFLACRLTGSTEC
ncbi:hypothetical protein E4U22_005498 [Claviceps purpurea]|nr:hypothetical protein E4U22_005498 [Claviceps purpurea]